MRVTAKLSADFDPAAIVDPAHRGEVAWGQFNRSFDRLQAQPWWRINEGRRHPLWLRLLRLGAAFVTQKRDAILDLRRKAAAFARMPLPRDPDIVYFGAEAGWEALLVQALFGAGGRVLLIDSDPAAFARFCAAPEEVRVRAPRGWPTPELVVRRDRARIEYVQADLFTVEERARFDVGIDWGLIEHYPDAGKEALLAVMRRFLRPGALEISSCPRDTVFVRLFYRAFRDEVNFGYRELMSLAEHRAHLERAGLSIVHACTLPAHNVLAARAPAGPG